MTPAPGSARPGLRAELLRLAWPAVLSYILNNAYRINDQFWIQGLGADAQAAIGSTFFVQVLNFALVFLAVGGTLALVSRAVGANEPGRRDAIARTALGLGLAIGAALTALVLPLLEEIVATLGLAGGAAHQAHGYLGGLYPFMAGIAMFPVLDSIFIARGNTRVPMALQACAVAMNYVLNPLLIYGRDAAERVRAPGVAEIGALARWLDLEGMGIRGAAVATGVARVTVVLAGLAILRGTYGMRLLPRGLPDPRAVLRHAWAILRVSGPSSASIAVYGGAYVLLLRFVLTPLGDVVVAGLGVGFQVFEGVAFPCYLGLSMAGSSLVGREIGARDREGVLAVVSSLRRITLGVGAGFALAFWFGGPALVPLFTEDAGVARETLLYVRVLAFSQLFVAIETANERVLLGAGQTRSILWISPLGNLLRVPLGWFLALGPAGLGAAGVWWTINATTVLKALLYRALVQRGTWLERAWAEPPTG